MVGNGLNMYPNRYDRRGRRSPGVTLTLGVGAVAALDERAGFPRNRGCRRRRPPLQHAAPLSGAGCLLTMPAGRENVKG